MPQDRLSVFVPADPRLMTDALWLMTTSPRLMTDTPGLTADVPWLVPDGPRLMIGTPQLMTDAPQFVTDDCITADAPQLVINAAGDRVIIGRLITKIDEMICGREHPIDASS